MQTVAVVALALLAVLVLSLLYFEFQRSYWH
jgi:hypothetical protein